MRWSRSLLSVQIDLVASLDLLSHCLRDRSLLDEARLGACSRLYNIGLTGQAAIHSELTDEGVAVVAALVTS